MTPPAPYRRTGLTLIELLVAITITALTGLAVAAVTTSVARSIDSMNDARSALQRAYAAHARLRAHTANALAFLSVEEDQGIAVWNDDSRMNGRVNLSELRIFWIEESEEEGIGNEMILEQAAFPEDWDQEELESADAELAGIDDPFQEMLALRSQEWTQRTTIADSIVSVDVTHSAITLTDANRVSLTLTVRVGEEKTEDILIVFGLSNHKAPD